MNTENDMNVFMEMAIQEAMDGISNRDGGPFGCVIVKNGVVVGKGHNEVLRRNDPTCHGEMMAIKDACNNLGTYDLSQCELYSTSQPCVMCMGAIMWSNISSVYYGCTVQDAENIGFRDKKFSEQLEDFSGTIIDRDDCLRLFNKYCLLKDKVIY